MAAAGLKLAARIANFATGFLSFHSCQIGMLFTVVQDWSRFVKQFY